VKCNRVIGKPYRVPDPPPLPKVRVEEAPPFSVTGVDFTGALYVKNATGSETKCYICLFTCAATRAVHLEVVPDLSTDAFLQAFRRFTSRKSLPKVMISDNATTYVAAANYIKHLFKTTAIQEELGKRGTEWRFIPKRAPWYGGFWERLIGLTKTTLRKILGRRFVTMETLQTIVTEIEAVMNDRPITYVSSNIDDLEPLTPSHLD
jgi:transposase InsO family protein